MFKSILSFIENNIFNKGGIDFALNPTMKNTMIYSEFKGRFLLGEISEQSETTIKVEIIYPFSGIFLQAQPKMCMLFSDKSQPILAKKLLIKCFELSQRIEKQQKELASEYKTLTEKLSKTRSKKKREELTEEFAWMYLNGFKPIPELLMNPKKDFMSFLETHFEDHQTLRINPAEEVNNPQDAAEKKRILQEWNQRDLQGKLIFIVHSIRDRKNQWIYPLFEKEFLMRLA